MDTEPYRCGAGLILGQLIVKLMNQVNQIKSKLSLSDIRVGDVLVDRENLDVIMITGEVEWEDDKPVWPMRVVSDPGLQWGTEPSKIVHHSVIENWFELTESSKVKRILEKYE